MIGGGLREDGYKPEMAAMVKAMCRLGATDFEICTELEICKSTLYNWKWKYPELAAAMVLGKKAADDRVEAALYERAVGYNFESTKIMSVADGNGSGSHVEKIPFVEHIPPDVRAAEYWLNNRRPTKWQHRVVQEHGGTVKFENIQRDSKDLEA